MMNRAMADVGGRKVVGRLILAASSCLLLSLSFLSAANLPRVLIWESTLPETEEHNVRWPVALAAASGSEMAVADAFGPRLLLFRRTGATWQLQSAVDLPGAPVSLIHDGARYIASLRGAEALFAFEGPKLLQRRIGLPGGVVPGALAALPDGGLLVYDVARERVLRLDEQSALQQETRVEGPVSSLAATSTGGFFAATPTARSVRRFDANGELDASWSIPGDGPVPAWPAGVVVDALGDILVLDGHGDRVLFLDTSGKAIAVGSRRGAEPGLLRFPKAIVELPDGRIAVADQGNGRVQIFDRSDRETAR